MGIFHSIKKSRRESSDIDGKIEYLNKELEKTGLREAMTTSNMYFSGEKVPNQDYNDFESTSEGGYGLALSGADGNNVGNADVGVHLGQEGVALSPPHPVTGVRINAVHVRDGLGGTQALRPGAVIKRGFADNAPDYTMGSALWFFDPDYDNGVGQPAGKWCNFEWGNFENNTGWGFWDTIKTGQFAGLYVFNRNLGEHPCASGDLAGKISGLNFSLNGAVGAPQTTVLNKNDLDDPGFLPIVIDLSVQAFNYLKDKAQNAAQNVKDIVADAVGNLNDFFDELGNAINNFDGTPVESNPDYTDLYDGIKDGLDLLNNVEDILKDSPKNENGDIEAGAEGSIENPLKNSVSDTTAETILNFDIDLAIEAGTLGTRIQSNVSASPGVIGGKGSIGAKGTHNNLPGGGKEDGGYPAPYVNENGDIVIPDTYAFRPHGHENRWLPKATEALIDTVNAHTNFIVNDNAKQEALDWAATVMDQSVGVFMGVPGRKDPIVHFETIIPKEQVDRIKANQSKSNQNESYISESAKLGHFEPEALTVDIEDLRKGIMPEFPKDPPPEMIDGYAANSRLAPKKIERDPFIKITKKDLAMNHKLKDSEIKDFMNQINAVNDFIKKHPEELIYAQARYPKSDPRLAQLNWQMDQMLGAGKEYMDKHYPENQKLFKKVQKSIKKNIELTDPKSFKGVKVPKFEGVDLTDFKRRKEVVARHYKKAVKVKKLFSRKKT